jgi:hypothetical protein
MNSRRQARVCRLPARHAVVVTPLLLSLLMTCVISLVSTLTGIGAGPGFLDKWLAAWGLSWLIAFPVLLFALPLVRRLTALLVEPS